MSNDKFITLKSVEVWFAKIHPKFPNARFDPSRPKFELQMRTTDKQVRKQWQELGFTVNNIENEEGDVIGYKTMVKKDATLKDGGAAALVKLYDRKARPLDVTEVGIGNGSIVNIRISHEPSKGENPKYKWTNRLIGIQLVKLIPWNPEESGGGFEDLDGDDDSADEDEDFTDISAGANSGDSKYD